MIKMNEEIKSIVHYYQVSNVQNMYYEYVFNADSYTDFIYRFAITEQLSDYREKTINEYRKEFVGIIDSNGKYYMTNYFFSIPTELRLNFKNEKETPPIKPNLLDELKITRSMINNF